MTGTNSRNNINRNKKIYGKILKARKMDAEQIFYAALERDSSSCELVKCYSMPYRRRRKSSARRKVGLICIDVNVMYLIPQTAQFLDFLREYKLQNE